MSDALIYHYAADHERLRFATVYIIHYNGIIIIDTNAILDTRDAQSGHTEQ